jgi:pheromone receptor transcription factor
VLLLISSERGQIYSFATPKLQPILVNESSKQLIEQCLNAPDPSALVDPQQQQQQAAQAQQAPPQMPPQMPPPHYMAQPPMQPGMHPAHSYAGGGVMVPPQMPMNDPHHAAAMAHAQAAAPAQAAAHAQAAAGVHPGYMMAPDGSMVPSPMVPR